MKNNLIFQINDYEKKQKLSSIIFVGDISSRYHFEDLMINNPSEIYDPELLSILKSADYRICNLETVFCKGGKKNLKSGPNLQSKPDVINGLIFADFNLACLANNHVLDFGEDALKNTINSLNENGISHTGADIFDEKLKPFIFNINDIKIGILNCADAEESAQTRRNFGAFELDQTSVSNKIAEIKKKVDYVLVIIHAGREYVQIPSPRIYQLYKRFIRDGADVIIGHHPHVPQGVKIIKNSIIAYSLGNFIFPSSKKLSKKNPYVNIGYMLKITFGSDNIKKFEIIPFKIDKNRISLFSGEKKQRVVDNFWEITELLKDSITINEFWNIYYNKLQKGSFFPYFAGALLNGLSERNFFRKIKFILLTAIWIIRFGFRSKKDAAKALNYLKNPNHRELFIDTLENLLDKE